MYKLEKCMVLGLAPEYCEEKKKSKPESKFLVFALNSLPEK